MAKRKSRARDGPRYRTILLDRLLWLQERLTPEDQELMNRAYGLDRIVPLQTGEPVRARVFELGGSGNQEVIIGPDGKVSSAA